MAESQETASQESDCSSQDSAPAAQPSAKSKKVRGAAKPKVPLYHACDGFSCTGFECVDALTDLKNGVGSQQAVLTWWIRHFTPRCACGNSYAADSFHNRGEQKLRLLCSACKKTAPALVGTPFAEMRTSPQEVFFTIHLFCYGFGQQQIADLDIGVKTVRAITDILCNLIRAFNFIEFVDTSQGDLWAEVQVDETAIGNRKYNRGARRRIDGVLWVAGLVQISEDKVMKMIARIDI